MAHRKTVRHFHEVGHLHELTFSCYRRMPLLTNDAWREKLAQCVEAAGTETTMQLVGFVFLPEHVHLLVYPISSSPEYIHNNPVGRDLWRRAVDWKWSSARYYLDVPPRQQHRRLLCWSTDF